jgi:peptide chain release factor 1
MQPQSVLEPFAMIDRENIEGALARLAEVEAELSEPNATANHVAYRELVREHASLKKLERKAQSYLELVRKLEGARSLAEEESDPELTELARAEMAEAEQALPAAESELLMALLPTDPDEHRNAILEIRAGTGGDEAALFAGDLYRMYGRFAESRGWQTNVIDASTSEIGGYKEVVFAIEGEGAYGLLRHEMGGHRVQRVPVTESQGRIHTSAATVAVFPQVEEEDHIDIPADDLRIDIFCASGPGGQGVNTTYSAVRITHLPTGLVAQSQDERSQHRNKEKALSVLSARILDARRREEAERKGDARRTQIGSGDRSERVRTYNFPQNRLTDHRINLTLYSLDRIIEGEMGALLEALREHDTRLRIKEELGVTADAE